MSPRKQRFFTTLATIIFLAVIGTANPFSTEVGAASAESNGRTKVFVPVQAFDSIQSRNARNLGPGKLLVASRGLADPLFARTVILLLRYDEQGVLGLVLNRRTDVPLSRVLDLKAAKSRSDAVYLGGPVGRSAAFGLLRSPSKVEGAENIFGEVYLISDRALFERTISAQPNPGVFHVYLGYAGWTEQQLQNEVELGAWFVFPGDAATIFNSDPDSLWPRMISKTELQFAKSENF